MIKRILASLEERRANLKDEDKGFTLIELLVVVIIIGVLVAIAIPVYIGLQDNAKDASAKSDLTNAKIAVVAYYAENPTAAAPALTTAGLGQYGFVQSAGTSTITFVGTPSSTTFCMTATSGSTGSPAFAIGSAIAVKSGATC